MKATKWMTLAAVAVMATACGGDDDNGNGPGRGNNGEFTASVAGDVETEFDGWAYFGEGEDEEGNVGFGLALSEVEAGEMNGGVITFVRIGATSLPEGEYALSDATGELADGDVVALAIDTEGNQLAAMFLSTGGTLNVTSSSGSRIRGTFEFTASGIVMEDPETQLDVTVEGTFDAVGQPDGSVRVMSMKAAKAAVAQAK